MANTYSPGYPVNPAAGSAGGDTVKAAIDKHIAEFLKAYADLTALYQQVLLELQYANVDTVDGKHADGTANNIPLLNGSGSLTNDINNTTVKTTNLTVGGTSISDLIASKSLGSFGNSLSTSGYQILSNGLCFQWGTNFVPSGGRVTVSFPKGFTQCYVVLATDANKAFNRCCTVGDISATTFSIALSDDDADPMSGSVNWLAIGLVDVSSS